MVRKTGIEPATFSLATKCTTTVLLTHKLAARLGFEPKLAESKSAVLPLHHQAKLLFVNSVKIRIVITDRPFISILGIPDLSVHLISNR